MQKVLSPHATYMQGLQGLQGDAKAAGGPCAILNLVSVRLS
jgi:hypothetical protein